MPGVVLIRFPAATKNPVRILGNARLLNQMIRREGTPRNPRPVARAGTVCPHRGTARARAVRLSPPTTASTGKRPRLKAGPSATLRATLSSPTPTAPLVSSAPVTASTAGGSWSSIAASTSPRSSRRASIAVAWPRCGRLGACDLTKPFWWQLARLTGWKGRR